jgi:hypothetical protein
MSTAPSSKPPSNVSVAKLPAPVVVVPPAKNELKSPIKSHPPSPVKQSQTQPVSTPKKEVPAKKPPASNPSNTFFTGVDFKEQSEVRKHTLLKQLFHDVVD